jgi:hypothetical protein
MEEKEMKEPTRTSVGAAQYCKTIRGRFSMARHVGTIGPLVFGVLTATSGPVCAQVNPNPLDTVFSDSNGNTALGSSALAQDTTSNTDTPAAFFYNTAVGANALFSNAASSYPYGYGNTAIGYYALLANTSGYWNTATGTQALQSNTTGNSNTATGVGALFSNTTGSDNAAVGRIALVSNTTGYNNVAIGTSALSASVSGRSNFAAGVSTLGSNVSGSYNVATGESALGSNTTGSNNTADGSSALMLSTGSNNVAVGYQAGFNLTTGNNNIDIGNLGNAGESGTIRIGAAGLQTRTFIAGIRGNPVAGNAVVISPSGQLGVVVSSERYKTDIHPMGSSTEKLDQLRPVTFRLKNDLQGPVQYGLIAEEVAEVYPELVIRAEDDRIDGVRYEELTPMLLNELQRQEREIAIQKAQVADQARQLREMQQQLAQLRELDEQRSALKARFDTGPSLQLRLPRPAGL